MESEPTGKEWLGSLRKILEADNLMKDKNSERLSDELAESIGFPFTGRENMDTHEFWDLVIDNLKNCGYKIVDDVYAEDIGDDMKHKRKMVEVLSKSIGR